MGEVTVPRGRIGIDVPTGGAAMLMLSYVTRIAKSRSVVNVAEMSRSFFRDSSYFMFFEAASAASGSMAPSLSRTIKGTSMEIGG